MEVRTHGQDTLLDKVAELNSEWEGRTLLQYSKSWLQQQVCPHLLASQSRSVHYAVPCTALQSPSLHYTALHCTLHCFTAAGLFTVLQCTDFLQLPPPGSIGRQMFWDTAARGRCGAAREIKGSRWGFIHNFACYYMRFLVISHYEQWHTRLYLFLLVQWILAV